MGWLDGSSVVSSGRSKRHSSHSHKRRRSRSRSRSKSRSRSRDRKAASVVSFFAGAPSAIGENYIKNNVSKSSFFGLGNGSRSFFGLGRSSSHYKRSPRPNFVHRAWKKLKRILRDLIHYAKRHPMKVFMLVIMPLITTGALAGLLAKFGLRLPRNIERMIGLAAKAGSGDSLGLVGEAVRMAGDMGGGGGGSSSSSSSSSRTTRSYESFGGGGGGRGRRSEPESDWGAGWGMGDGLKYVGKMFI